MIKRLLETDGILNGAGRVKGNGNNIKQILTKTRSTLAMCCFRKLILWIFLKRS
ncbi:hypothetical protein [Gudongella oleilytica]|uniref:hypothetical protein n=1 Tax=Gudongella oleilytica TaxID=1582259 RepID=UPI002A36FDD8|nr:hypothetical protein [Gudongella oleilytica]MDY0256200.1 hypothetical protein [Gudongella oleilytica]